MKDILLDSRTPWFNVHSVFDEQIPWSVDAYRVYGHLCRRVGNSGSTAFPSYSSIGKVCFQHDYKGKTQPCERSLRARAIRAITELKELGMVSVEHRQSDSHGNQSNLYTLTHTDKWRLDPGHLQSPPWSSPTTPLVMADDPPGYPQSPISNSKISNSKEGSNSATAEKGTAALPTAAAIPPGQVQGISQASPVKRIEAVGEGECSAAAPHPGNFERTRYGKAPSPIMSHYGMGYMVAGRDGVNLRFEPRLVRGMQKIGRNWPGDTAITSDGKAIAYIRKLLSQLMQPQYFEAAWARLELAWEEGGEAAVVPMKRLSQYEELVAQYGSPMGGAA
jgi:hypothetical protein